MMTKIFKFTAILEGISYLVLFANMLFIKPNNFSLYKTLLYPIGMAHGVLFIGYVILAFLIKKSQNWSLKDFCIVQIASLLPFGTFYIEKKYVKNA
jgi:integral membrane protein